LKTWNSSSPPPFDQSHPYIYILYIFTQNPILECSIPPRLYLGCYIKALLLPPSCSLDTLCGTELPNTPAVPEWVGWKTKGIVEGLEEAGKVKPGKKLDVGFIFCRISIDDKKGREKVKDEGDYQREIREDGIDVPSGHDLLPNSSPVGRFVSCLTMGLYTQKTIQNMVTGYIKVVNKLTNECERGEGNERGRGAYIYSGDIY